MGRPPGKRLRAHKHVEEMGGLVLPVCAAVQRAPLGQGACNAARCSRKGISCVCSKSLLCGARRGAWGGGGSTQQQVLGLAFGIERCQGACQN